jgi:DHA2 family multidrug resistance protein
VFHVGGVEALGERAVERREQLARLPSAALLAPQAGEARGTAIRSLMRNLGGSIGISILVATLAENTQVVHSRLVESLRPDNPLSQAPYLATPFSLSTPSGMAALNAEVTRQAAMVA